MTIHNVPETIGAFTFESREHGMTHSSLFLVHVEPRSYSKCANLRTENAGWFNWTIGEVLPSCESNSQILLMIHKSLHTKKQHYLRWKPLRADHSLVRHLKLACNIRIQPTIQKINSWRCQSQYDAVQCLVAASNNFGNSKKIMALWRPWLSSIVTSKKLNPQKIPLSSQFRA